MQQEPYAGFSLKLVKRYVMNKKYILLILSLSFMFFSCHKKKKEPMQVFPVKTVCSIKKDAPIYIENIGHVEPVMKIDVRSRVDGILQEVFFKEGEEVKKGDIIFTIDPRNYKAELDKQEGLLQENTANFTLAKDKVIRYKDLYKDEYISAIDYETILTNYTKYDAIIKQNEADLDNAKANLSYCWIYSPIDGKTGILNYDKGNLIAKDDTTPIISINQIKPIYVTFFVPEKDLIKIQKYVRDDLKILATFDDFTKDSIEGELNLIDNEIDQNTAMIKIRGIFKNEDKRLWPGLFVRTRLILTIKKDAIIIPFQAIQLTPDGPVVFVVKDNDTVEMKKVVLGQREDNNIIVESGIGENEKVVIQGQINLLDGSKIFETKGIK